MHYAQQYQSAMNTVVGMRSAYLLYHACHLLVVAPEEQHGPPARPNREVYSLDSSPTQRANVGCNMLSAGAVPEAGREAAGAAVQRPGRGLHRLVRLSHYFKSTAVLTPPSRASVEAPFTCRSSFPTICSDIFPWADAHSCSIQLQCACCMLQPVG